MFILSGEYPPEPGGVSDHSFNLTQSLRERNLPAIVLCGGYNGMAMEDGVEVHRVAGQFQPNNLSALAPALESWPGPRVVWVQYAPHAFGLRGMNLPLALWLAWRAWFHQDKVVAYFHEVAFPFRGPWKHKLLSMVQLAMAGIVVASASAVLATTEAWLPRLQSLGLRRGAARVLPVFSNLPEEVNPDAVARRRDYWLEETGARQLVGHFGTYGGGVAALLEESLAAFPSETSTTFLLLGRRASPWLARYASQPWAARCRPVPEDDPMAVAETLAACDAALQPYPDGITTRRTTAMSALALGVPLVSNLGILRDSCWKRDTPCAALALRPEGRLVAGELARVLVLELEILKQKGARGRAWYRQNASRAVAARAVAGVVAGLA